MSLQSASNGEDLASFQIIDSKQSGEDMGKGRYVVRPQRSDEEGNIWFTVLKELEVNGSFEEYYLRVEREVPNNVVFTLDRSRATEIKLTLLETPQHNRYLMETVIYGHTHRLHVNMSDRKQPKLVAYPGGGNPPDDHYLVQLIRRICENRL